MEELKPCPFCGSRGYSDTSYEGHTYCDKCDAATVNDNWNARPIEDRLRAERDEARAQLSQIRAWSASEMSTGNLGYMVRKVI